MDRQQLVGDLMAYKESSNGYSSVFEEVRNTWGTYCAVMSSSAIEAVTHGRAKVKVDAAVYAHNYEQAFRQKKHAWAIISDYASLFAGIYQRRKGIARIENSEGAPCSL